MRLEGRAVALPGRRQRALLTLLLLRANEVASVDALADGLWAAAAPWGPRRILGIDRVGVWRERFSARVSARATAADEQLAQLADALAAADAEACPYAGPEYLGAFACWGLPVS